MEEKNNLKSIDLSVFPENSRQSPSMTKTPSEREFERENFYTCCSGNTTDKRVIEYFTKFSVCFIVLLFCIVQLIRLGGDCTADHLYGNILSMILGVFLPSPVITRKDKK